MIERQLLTEDAKKAISDTIEKRDKSKNQSFFQIYLDGHCDANTDEKVILHVKNELAYYLLEKAQSPEVKPIEKLLYTAAFGDCIEYFGLSFSNDRYKSLVEDILKKENEYLELIRENDGQRCILKSIVETGIKYNNESCLLIGLQLSQKNSYGFKNDPSEIKNYLFKLAKNKTNQFNADYLKQNQLTGLVEYFNQNEVNFLPCLEALSHDPFTKPYQADIHDQLFKKMITTFGIPLMDAVIKGLDQNTPSLLLAKYHAEQAIDIYKNKKPPEYYRQHIDRAEEIFDLLREKRNKNIIKEINAIQNESYGDAILALSTEEKDGKKRIDYEKRIPNNITYWKNEINRLICEADEADKKNLSSDALRNQAIDVMFELIKMRGIETVYHITELLLADPTISQTTKKFLDDNIYSPLKKHVKKENQMTASFDKFYYDNAILASDPYDDLLDHDGLLEKKVDKLRVTNTVKGFIMVEKLKHGENLDDDLSNKTPKKPKENPHKIYVSFNPMDRMNYLKGWDILLRSVGNNPLIRCSKMFNPINATNEYFNPDGTRNFSAKGKSVEKGKQIVFYIETYETMKNFYEENSKEKYTKEKYHLEILRFIRSLEAMCKEYSLTTIHAPNEHKTESAVHAKSYGFEENNIADRPTESQYTFIGYPAYKEMIDPETGKITYEEVHSENRSESTPPYLSEEILELEKKELIHPDLTQQYQALLNTQSALQKSHLELLEKINQFNTLSTNSTNSKISLDQPHLLEERDEEFRKIMSSYLEIGDLLKQHHEAITTFVNEHPEKEISTGMHKLNEARYGDQKSRIVQTQNISATIKQIENGSSDSYLFENLGRIDVNNITATERESIAKSKIKWIQNKIVNEQPGKNETHLINAKTIDIYSKNPDRSNVKKTIKISHEMDHILALIQTAVKKKENDPERWRFCLKEIKDFVNQQMGNNKESSSLPGIFQSISKTLQEKRNNQDVKAVLELINRYAEQDNQLTQTLSSSQNIMKR